MLCILVETIVVELKNSGWNPILLLYIYQAQKGKGRVEGYIVDDALSICSDLREVFKRPDKAEVNIVVTIKFGEVYLVFEDLTDVLNKFLQHQP